MVLDASVEDSQIVDYPHQSSAQFDAFGIDDAVMSDGLEAIENVLDSGHNNAQASIVEETQYESLEKDTQAPTQTIFQISANVSTSTVPDHQPFLPIMRHADPLEDMGSSFKFGQPPKTTPGQFTYNPGQKKSSAVASASSLPVSPAAIPLNKSAAPATATNIAPASSNTKSVATVTIKSDSVQTPPSPQRPKVLCNASTASDQTSNTSTSSITNVVGAQAPTAKPVSDVSDNAAVPSHKQKPASAIRTDDSTRRSPSPSPMKSPRPVLDPRPLEHITAAVPTTITDRGTTAQLSVSKCLPKPSSRGLPDQKPRVDFQGVPQRGADNPETPVKGKRVLQSASKPPAPRKSLVQEGPYRIPKSLRPQTMACPFPEVQGKTPHFKQTSNPRLKPNNPATQTSFRHSSVEISQVYHPEPLENPAVHHPRNNETRPITPVHPAYESSFAQPNRAGAESPAISELSQPNTSARMKRATPQEQSPQVTRPMKRPAPATPQEGTPDVLGPMHNAKVSKSTSKHPVNSAPCIKSQTTKAIAASPKKNVPNPLVVEQAIDVMSIEPEHFPPAKPVPVPLAAVQVAREVPPEPKKARSKSNTLKDWVWRENLSRIYEEKISSLETELEDKQAEIKSVEEKLKQHAKGIRSTAEALQSSKVELQSMHQELQSTRKAEEEAKNRIEYLEAEKVETVKKVRKWERLRFTYEDHMNKVVDKQNALTETALEIKAGTLTEYSEIARMNEAAAEKKEEATKKNKAIAEHITKVLEEIKAEKDRLRSLADAEKAAAEAKRKLAKVMGEKNAIQEELKAVKETNTIQMQTIDRQREDMDKYLLTAQQEGNKAEKFQKQLNAEKEALTQFIGTLENLPQKVTQELSKEDGALAKLLASGTSLQDKFDEATKILDELKKHEIQPSSPLVKTIENLFAQIPQPLSPSQDGRVSTEQAITKLHDDLKESLSGFAADIQTQTKLEAKISELEQNNKTLSTTESSTKQENEKLAGELEVSRRQVSDYRGQLESKTRELEAEQALLREDSRMVAKIEELKGTNLSLRGQLQDLARLQEENQNLQESIGEFESQCSRHEKEKQDIRDFFTAEKKNDNEVAEKVRKEFTFQSDRKIKSLKQTLKEVESNLNQLNSKRTTLLEDNKKLREDGERCGKAHESNKVETQKLINELAAKNTLLENQVSGLKSELTKSVKLTQVATEKGVLQNQISDLKAELANCVKPAQVAAEKEVLQNQIADLRAELAKSVKPAQVAVEKEALLKQISELQANAAMREDDVVLRRPLMDTPRNMLRKNSQKHFTRPREIPETQLEEDIEDSQEKLTHVIRTKPSLPAKRRPSGRLGLTGQPATSALGNTPSSRDSKFTLRSIPDSQQRSQEPTGVRYQESDARSLGSGRGDSQASCSLLSSQPVHSTPVKLFAATESGNWSANSALTDVGEFDGDIDQLGTVYEQARAKKAKTNSSTMAQPPPSGYQPTPPSQQFSNPDEKSRAQNVANRAPARRQPSHRKTSASALKSALKPSSTNMGSQDVSIKGPSSQSTMTASPIKIQAATKKNPYNRVASGSTSNRHQVPSTSPIHNGGVSRRNSAFKGLGKRKAESELESPKAPKAMLTRTLSNNRSKMPPPPLELARRTFNRSSAGAPPDHTFSASPRVSLPPLPTAAPKARNPVRR